MVRAISMREARAKDYARILRRASPWNRRAIEGWRGFKRGVAWVMLGGGVPAKVPVYLNGVIDDWPYHIAMCEVVSMDGSLVLKHRLSRSKQNEYWYLVNRKGKYKWGKSGPRGKVQTAYRFKTTRRAA